MTVSVETLGQVVRDAWVKWARRQPDPKPGWLVPWEALNEADKDADRSIGAAVYAFVSRETSAEPLLFWRMIADDATLAVEHKLHWLAASYQHCQALAGMSMPFALLEQSVGVAAVMARIADQLLALAGSDPLIDALTVKWLCLACDQLWEFVPPEARQEPQNIDPANLLFAKWLAELERRLPGLDLAVPVNRVGERMVLVCPACQWQHPPDTAICRNCAAPLRHVQPMPYPIGKTDRDPNTAL
jgi:rubredoxin